MAYTDVTVVKSTTAGVRHDGQGTAGAAGGDGTGLSFSNDGHTILLLENTAGNTPAVVIKTGATVGGLAVADVTVTMVANQDKVVGPFPVNIYNTGTIVQMYFSGGNETELQVLPVRI